MGLQTVAVYAGPDSHALHTTMADHARRLEGDDAAATYLDGEALVAAALASGAEAVHPGYGFLAENADFARRVSDAGLIFVGPSPEAIETMGDKIRAREIAAECGLPLIPSAQLGDSKVSARRAAKRLGYPVLVKAAAGGGGRGMRVVQGEKALQDAIDSARREAESSFGDGRVYLEKYLDRPRHIEIQIFADDHGRVLQLGERECSVQRRHQKIIEESPAPLLSDETRTAMSEAAAALASTIGYRGAGTVEFIVDEEECYYFLEMNTRLQVEHAVTEMTTSTDLVRWQLDIARGSALPETAPETRGHAIECRVYAEDPSNSFLPTGGRVLGLQLPTGPGVRVDSCLFEGFEVPLQYDPMLAKVIVWAPDRTQALTRAGSALAEFGLLGVRTNLAFLIDILASELFRDARFFTTTIEERYGDWRATPPPVEVSAAAALAAAFGPASLSVAHERQTEEPGPWATLGPWRPGQGKARP